MTAQRLLDLYRAELDIVRSEAECRHLLGTSTNLAEIVEAHQRLLELRDRRDQMLDIDSVA